MITLTINADTTGDLHRELIALLAGTAMVAAGAAAAAPKAATTRTKKTEEQPPAGNAADTTGSGADATGSGAQSSAADDGPVTKDGLSALVLQYGAKAGPQAVGELFGEFGAAKFSEIAEDKYPAVKVRLDELLAA